MENKRVCKDCVGYLPKTDTTGECWCPFNREPDSDLPRVEATQEECYFFSQNTTVNSGKADTNETMCKL